MAEAIKSALPFAVDELFSVSTIDVVRSVSADKLKSALQWLVDCVSKLQEEHKALQQTIANVSLKAPEPTETEIGRAHV